MASKRTATDDDITASLEVFMEGMSMGCRAQSTKYAVAMQQQSRQSLQHETETSCFCPYPLVQHANARY